MQWLEFAAVFNVLRQKMRIDGSFKLEFLIYGSLPEC